jgi:hypothetical protein
MWSGWYGSTLAVDKTKWNSTAYHQQQQQQDANL